jgi:hypothetical protein
MRRMSYQDLPEGWSTQPLTDPRLVADVLDLCVSPRARHDGALCLLLCDAGDRLRTPVVVDQVPATASGAERARTLTRLLTELADIDADVSLLAAIARRGGLSVRPDDHTWAEAIASAAADCRIRLLGVHIITPDGSRPIPRGSRAA